jgi:hypothetical protein
MADNQRERRSGKHLVPFARVLSAKQLRLGAWYNVERLGVRDAPARRFLRVCGKPRAWAGPTEYLPCYIGVLAHSGDFICPSGVVRLSRLGSQI